ncbi:MAG: flavodoxin family protein [Candidatus Methanoplasma sp.]|jgi:multimeric flavodoxin WrbA|nr:flavodoxin family protein [Candidatus Methanoplasma sp.]
MKVVAFNCSPRENGNTSHMIGGVLKALESHDVETELVQVGGRDVHGCRACGACFKNRNMKCIQGDDIVNLCVEKMVSADGIVIGSPTYFSDVTSEAKALIDRCGYVTRANGMALRRKAGAAVSAARRAGSIHSMDSINHFFTINEMFVVGSTYWNISLSRAEGDYEKDDEGVKTMKDLGENMAWLLSRIGGAQ